MFVLLLALLAPGLRAHAAPPPADAAVVTPSAGAAAEYKRLHEELDRLAKRNAWTGAERTYQAMLQTGAPMQFDDLKIGAQVAMAFGDIAVVRERLEAASKLREDREVIESLFAIDQSYGRVSLAGDPGEVELVVDTPPFDPTYARAIENAVERVRQTGTFEGLLPRGSYTFAGRQVAVGPGVSTPRIDVRSDAGVRKSSKAKKKADRGT